ncbi:hypothetical protein [Microbulbifer marinus]|uniref:hypothetical protein n=1 Tax=Microbulbifer marinus TaxID=658218 RepID=UPI00147A9BD8|nr:hypothetical protein [Microbulbifer marinus]
MVDLMAILNFGFYLVDLKSLQVLKISISLIASVKSGADNAGRLYCFAWLSK